MGGSVSGWACCSAVRGRWGEGIVASDGQARRCHWYCCWLLLLWPCLHTVAALMHQHNTAKRSSPPAPFPKPPAPYTPTQHTSTLYCCRPARHGAADGPAG